MASCGTHPLRPSNAGAQGVLRQHLSPERIWALADPISQGVHVPVTPQTVLNQEHWWFPWPKATWGGGQGVGSYLHCLCNTQDIAAPVQRSVHFINYY